MKKMWIVVLVCLVALMTVSAVQAQMKEMKKPEMVTISGTVIDLTCAVKAKAMMDSWKNTEQDHMMPDGAISKGCATMCLNGGQPAALFASEKVTAVFACNPKATLSNFAAESVDVQGFWAGSTKDDARSFVPAKIRSKGGEWQDVDCATMHG